MPFVLVNHAFGNKEPVSFEIFISLPVVAF
jgi:hypothetical protein